MKFFDYKNATEVLKEKGLFSELEEILNSITDVDHKKIQQAFSNKGWELEKNIIPETSWRWDAFKNKVIVSIEFSLIDAVHRDFLRLLIWHHEGNADAVIYITTTFKEPKFHNVKRDIEIFQRYPDMLPLPLLLIGLDKGGE